MLKALKSSASNDSNGTFDGFSVEILGVQSLMPYFCGAADVSACKTPRAKENKTTSAGATIVAVPSLLSHKYQKCLEAMPESVDRFGYPVKVQ